MAAAFGASPSTMVAGRAALKRAGQQANQGPINQSGTGMGPPAPQDSSGMGAAHYAAQAAQQGMAPKIASPMQVLSQPQRQQGQVQAQGRPSAPPPPGQVIQGGVNAGQALLDKAKQAASNGPQPPQGAPSGGPPAPGDVAKKITDTATLLPQTIKDAAGSAPTPQSILQQIMQGGGGGLNIMTLLQQMGLLPGGSGPNLFGGMGMGGGGGDPTRSPTATSGTGGRSNDPGGSTGSGGSRGPGVVTAPGQFPSKVSPLQVLAQKNGVQPGMGAQQPGVQGSNLGAAPGSNMPTTGLNKNNSQYGSILGAQQGSQQGQGAAGAYNKGTTQADGIAPWDQSKGYNYFDPNGGTDPHNQTGNPSTEADRFGRYITTGNNDPISQAANAVSDVDRNRFNANFDKFNVNNQDANSNYSDQINDYQNSTRIGDAAEAASRQGLDTQINTDRDANMRDLASRQSRGGVVGTGAATGIYNTAENQRQAGMRGLAQDAYGREIGRLSGLGNARGALAQNQTMGNMFDYQNQLNNYTSNKELMAQMMGIAPELLDALSPG